MHNCALDWVNTLHSCARATIMRGMTSTRWWRHVTGIIGDSTYREAADKAGFDKSAFTRWKKGARADPDFVVKVARAYDANVLEALVEAEFITETEAGNKPASEAVADAVRELELEVNRLRAAAELTESLNEGLKNALERFNPPAR